MRDQGPGTGTQEGTHSTVRFVLAAIACAVLTGLAVITATVLGVDALRGNSGPRNLDQSFYVLVGGTFLGVFLAGYAAWRLLAPIESDYRRGGLAMVCAFATVMLMIVCIPVHQLLGANGLAGLLAVSVLVALVLGHRLVRIGIRG